MHRLGYTKLPSFPVQFSSSVVNGLALFVPASGEGRGCASQSFDVEINQEKVSKLKRGGLDSVESVAALPEANAYEVSGKVISVVPIGEPEGHEVITVQAGEAIFTLSWDELGGVKLSLGERVTFIAHTLSLWDEAI